MSESPIRSRRSLTVVAYGCSVLLCVGIGTFVAWTAFGWARLLAGVQRAEALRFLAITRLIVLVPALLMILCFILVNRVRLLRVTVLVRPFKGAGDTLNIIRAVVLAVALILLGAGAIGLTSWSPPYAFYEGLRVITCLAWVSLLTAAGIKNVARLDDVVLIGLTFLCVFTPVWPLRLSRTVWAAIDILAALALCAVLLSVMEHASAEKDGSPG